MNLTLREYIKTLTKPKLSYHVKYSDFFEKQYEKLDEKLIGVFFNDKPIYFYTWKAEYEKFKKLLHEKKLTYKNKLVGEDENWEYLLEYSVFFEKGFNSIDYNTPAGVIINQIPFCTTQTCIIPENSKNKVIGIGRKSANSTPCIAGMRPISFDSLFGQALLQSTKINNVTNERVLKSPEKTAFNEGVMFKSIFQVIERYTEFKEHFDIPGKPLQEFIDILIKGIRELQTQDVNAECIRKIKKNNGNNEALFRDWFKTYFASIYDSVNAEPEKGNGRIDLKIQDSCIGNKIIEFKGWWNNDKKQVCKQINSYLTDFEKDGYIIMINHNKNKNITSEYLALIKAKEMGYLEKSLEERQYKNTGFDYYLTKHFDNIRTRTLHHFIINVF
jgi:hypothetical protein